MLRRTLTAIILGFSPVISYSQTGGDNVYEFLNLTHSGLITSIGGSNVSLAGTTLNLAWHNPSLLNTSMDNSIALNYSNYFAGINYGLAMYSRNLDSKSNLAAGITYLNYGSFTGADASGNITGSFSASESALTFIYSREIDSLIAIGINFKPVLSNLEKYNSFGFAFDIGASWHSRNNLISAGFVLRNIGYQVTTYAGESRGKLPFEIMAGISARLAHAPFRFSLTLRHLEKYDLTYSYDGSDENSAPSSSEFLENFMKHVIAGVEIIPHRNFYLSLGYNHQRRTELYTSSGGGGSGFSWGFGFNSSYINVEFGRASYHPAGSSNNFTVILHPDLLYKRKTNSASAKPGS